jgi:hypothetical protein
MPPRRHSDTHCHERWHSVSFGATADQRKLMAFSSSRIAKLYQRSIYTIDQGSPCPLATLNPFGRELLLSDVSTGIKWSTWIERSTLYMIMYINMNMNINMNINMNMNMNMNMTINININMTMRVI